MRHPLHRCGLVAAFTFLPITLTRAQAPAGQREDLVFHDFLDANGELTGGATRMLVADRESVHAVLPAHSATVHGAVPPPGSTFLGAELNTQNRIDFVFVGDGYTEGQLGAYANHVAELTAEFFDEEPFRSYASYYNVHRVDVVSNDSGVDNAPFGAERDTALDMRYWCGGVERRLCVDIAKAYAYAANAPDADLVAAIANSAKYGGAGYLQSDLATAAARNASAGELLLHEMGHAHGDLADEYFFANGATHGDYEETWRNVSYLPQAEMAASGTKWAAWLGLSAPEFAGLHTTFQGAGQYQFGLYRPTNSSKMRNLGRPFNLPSVEALILEMYQIVDPVDGSSPVNEIHGETDVLFVRPLRPLEHELTVRWFLNDVPLAFDGEELDLAALDLTAGWQLVRAVVTDETSWVRDEAARAAWMTQTLQFVVQSAGSADVASFCTAVPNSTGAGAHLTGSGSSSLAAGKLVARVSGAPRSVAGILRVGMAPANLPFGDGVLCTEAIGTLAAFTASAAGAAEIPVDAASLPGGAVAPGDTRYFQALYRDPLAGLAGFNLSDGLRVTFRP